MSLTEEATGTTTTDGSEQSLSSSLSGKTYQFVMDVHNMANADTVEVRIYNKVLSGSTKRLILPVMTLNNIAPEGNVFSLWISGIHYYEVSIKRTAGTDRSYDWSILSI